MNTLIIHPLNSVNLLQFTNITNFREYLYDRPDSKYNEIPHLSFDDNKGNKIIIPVSSLLYYEKIK